MDLINFFSKPCFFLIFGFSGPIYIIFKLGQSFRFPTSEIGKSKSFFLEVCWSQFSDFRVSTFQKPETLYFLIKNTLCSDFLFLILDFQYPGIKNWKTPVLLKLFGVFLISDFRVSKTRKPTSFLAKCLFPYFWFLIFRNKNLETLKIEPCQILYPILPRWSRMSTHAKSMVQILLAIWFSVFKVRSYECFLPFWPCFFTMLRVFTVNLFYVPACGLVSFLAFSQASFQWLTVFLL